MTISDGSVVKSKIGCQMVQVCRTKLLGIQESLCVKVDGKEYAYFNKEKINENVAEIDEFDNKIALMVDGPISYYGTDLTAHKTLSTQFETHLKSKGFSDVMKCSESPGTQLTSFFEKLKTPKTMGILKIVSHGQQRGSTTEADNTDESILFGDIMDHDLSTMINAIDPTSFVLILCDVCFSDGLIDKSTITSDARYVFISAARENGSASDTSALYFYGGGYLTYHMINFIMFYDVFSIQEWYNRVKNDPGTYYNNSSGMNTHHPRIISNDETSSHKAIQF